MERKPNIIMIVTDHQLNYRHGWDGGARPLHPHFDELSKDAVSFDRAYAVTPLCGPARRTLLTGLYPHNHKNVHNQTESPYDHDVYLNNLSKEGYKNYYYGKWHAGPGTALDQSCEGLCPDFYGNPYITKEYEEYLEREGLPRAEHRIDNYFWNGSSKKQFPKLHEGNESYHCEQTWCGEPCLGITTTPKETHEGFFLADLACRKLDELSSEEGADPFHMRIDFWGPHQPYFPTQEFIDMYEASDIREYGSYSDDLRRKPGTYYNMNQPIADENFKLIIPSVFSWEEWQQIMVKAYAQTTMTDEAGGIIIDKLKELGMYEDTLIIWTSDHGDGLGSHGGMFDKGSFMTEETVRVPLTIKLPENEFGGSRLNALVNTIDIAPTILDCAHTEFSHPIDGESLLPVCRQERIGRDVMMIESYGQGYRDTSRSRTLVTDEYKYTVNEGDINELYCLSTDPYELDNLSGDTALESQLRSELSHQLELLGDTDGIEIVGSINETP